MININIILLIIPIFIIGCQKSIEIVEDNSPKINKLNMNIYTNQGVKIYSIMSPSSIYDRGSQEFNLQKTTIELFNNNKAEYVINSDNSKFSNLNKTIKLNGNVYIKSLIDKESSLNSDNFFWNYRSSNYLLTGNVRFEDENIILNSDKAIFNKSNNLIEFFNPVKYIIKDTNQKTKYQINSENAYYNIYTKSVSFTSSEERVRSKFYF